jgi:hypothetical protein
MEKNLDFTSSYVLLMKGDQVRAKYLMTVSDRGVVPMMQFKGTIIPNSARQSEYFDDLFPNSGANHANSLRYLAAYGVVYVYSFALGTLLYPPANEAEKRRLVMEWRDILDNSPIFTLTMGGELFKTYFSRASVSLIAHKLYCFKSYDLIYVIGVAGYYPDRYYKQQFPSMMRGMIRGINDTRLKVLQEELKKAKGGERLKATLEARLAAAQGMLDSYKNPRVFDEALLAMDAVMDRLEAQLAASGGPWIIGNFFFV